MSSWGQGIRGTNGRLPIKGQRLSDNARKNRQAMKDLSDCEFTTGMTAEQLKEFQAEQRASVLSKQRKAA